MLAPQLFHHLLKQLAWSLCLLACVLGARPAVAVKDPGSCQEARSIQTARRLVTGVVAGRSGALIADEQVTLPDTLPLAWRNESTRIQYEMELPPCRDAPSAALWLFRVGAPYSIEVNGQALPLISARGSLRHALGRPGDDHQAVYNGRLPALFGLPTGAQKVRIDLQTLPYIPAGLTLVQIGPTHTMLSLQAEQLFNVVMYADAGSGVVLVLGALTFTLWLRRRGNMSLLWMSIACALWGLRGLAYFDHAMLMRPVWFEQFNPLNVLLAGLALTASGLCILGPLELRHKRGLLACLLLGLSAIVAADLAGQGAGVARALAQALSAGATIWLAWTIWRRRQGKPVWEVGILMGSLALLVGCAAHDLLIVAGVRPPTSPTLVFWGFAVLLVGFAVVSGQYLVATLNRAEHSNEELERRVALKTRELESSYEQLRQNEREAARVQERDRLLRDMHDGIGAQLMTVLRGVERGALNQTQVAQSLQDSLDELRMLMDSTDLSHYLPGTLAAWRSRWQARLMAAGVELQWQLDDTLDQIHLPGESVLQIMRILQEAATNVVKHARARHMGMTARLAVAPGQRCLEIVVSDDGQGLPPGPVRPGARGLKNMQYRAGLIGASLEVTPAVPPARGSLVRFSLPLPAGNQDTSPRLAASMVASARDDMPSLR